MSPPHNNDMRVDSLCARHLVLEDTLSRIERTVTDGFVVVNRSLKEVGADLRDGAVEMTALKVKLAIIERLVFGAVGAALTGIVLAVLALILKT